MKLLIDLGGTKIAFCLIAPDGSTEEWECPGLSPLRASDCELHKAFETITTHANSLQHIHLYGGGITDPSVALRLRNFLPAGIEAEIGSDLLGAARSLLGSTPGVACILGTGSNSGLYNGHEITSNIPPLGYILGDEGSGASIGRRLLRKVYRQGVLRKEFEAATGLTYPEVIRLTYATPGANRFLASTAPFIKAHMKDLEDIILEEFEEFIGGIVVQYNTPNAAFTGGIAAAFEPQLRKVCQNHQLNVINVTARPMPGLINFHTN